MSSSYWYVTLRLLYKFIIYNGSKIGSDAINSLCEWIHVRAWAFNMLLHFLIFYFDLHKFQLCLLFTYPCLESKFAPFVQRKYFLTASGCVIVNWRLLLKFYCSSVQVYFELWRTMIVFVWFCRSCFTRRLTTSIWVIKFPRNWSYILMTNYFSPGKDYNRSLHLDYSIFCTQNELCFERNEYFLA